MEGLDDLPALVRQVIKDAAWDPHFNIREAPDAELIEVNFTQFAVNLLDKGVPVAQVAQAIIDIDAKITEHERRHGILPPEGRAA